MRGGTNVILAGKCDSHCHSTTYFTENVVVTKQIMLSNFRNFIIFSDQKWANNRNKHNNFCGEKKYYEPLIFRGVFF